MRCFILDEDHQPVETDLSAYCEWSSSHGTLADTRLSESVRVWTAYIGIDGPMFVHYVFEPGSLYRTVHSPTYDDAIGRHGRIAEWLEKRAKRRAESAREVFGNHPNTIKSPK